MSSEANDQSHLVRAALDYIPQPLLKDVDLSKKLSNNLNNKLRMYGTGEELKENLKIYQNFPLSYQKFGIGDYNSFRVVPIKFQSLKHRFFLCKQEVVRDFQQGIRETYNTIIRNGVRQKPPSHLLEFMNEQTKRLEGCFEFVPVYTTSFTSYSNELKAFQNYMRKQSSVSQQDFENFEKQIVQMVQNIAKNHPEVFLPDREYMKNAFVVKKVNNRLVQQNTKVFSVRVFDDENHKFFMKSELYNTINLKNFGRKVMKCEDPEGCLSTISVDFLIKELLKETLYFEFIYTPIIRAKHAAVPINTPTGGFCILAADVLLETLRRLIFGFNVFQKVKLNEWNIISDYMHILLSSFPKDMDGSYFMEWPLIEKIRSKTDDYWKEYENIPVKSVRDVEKSGFNMNNLKEELEYLELTEVFPEIVNHAEKVFKEVNQSKKKKNLRTCDMFEALEKCQVTCVLDRFPAIRNLLESQSALKKLTFYTPDSRWDMYQPVSTATSSGDQMTWQLENNVPTSSIKTEEASIALKEEEFEEQTQGIPNPDPEVLKKMEFENAAPVDSASSNGSDNTPEVPERVKSEKQTQKISIVTSPEILKDETPDPEVPKNNGTENIVPVIASEVSTSSEVQNREEAAPEVSKKEKSEAEPKTIPEASILSFSEIEKNEKAAPEVPEEETPEKTVPNTLPGVSTTSKFPIKIEEDPDAPENEEAEKQIQKVPEPILPVVTSSEIEKEKDHAAKTPKKEVPTSSELIHCQKCSEFSDDLNESRKEVIGAYKKISVLEKRLKEEKAQQIKELEKEKEDLKLKYVKVLNENVKKTDSLKNLESGRSRKNEELKKMLKEKDDQLEKFRGELNKETEKRNSEINEISKELDKMKASNSTLTQKAMKKDLETAQLKKSMSELDKEKNEEIEMMKYGYEKLFDQNMELEGKMKEMEENVKTRELETQRNKARTENLEKKLKELEDFKKKSKELVENQNQEIQKAQKENKKLKRILKNHATLTYNKNKEIQDIKYVNEQLKDEKSELEEKLKEMEDSQKEWIKNQNLEIQKVQKENEKKAENLEKRLKEIRRNHSRVVNNKNKDIQKIEHDNEQLIDQTTELKKKLKEMEESKKELIQNQFLEIQKAQKENNEKVDNLEKKLKETQNSHSRIVKIKNGEIEKIKYHIEKLSAEKLELEKKLRGMKESQKELIQNQSLEIQTAQKENNKKVENLEKKLTDSQNKLEEIQKNHSVVINLKNEEIQQMKSYQKQLVIQKNRKIRKWRARYFCRRNQRVKNDKRQNSRNRLNV